MITFSIPTSRTVIETKILEGKKVFKVGKRFPLGTGGSVELVIQNPSDSGRMLHMVNLVVRGTAEGELDIYLNSTIDTSGTSIDPVPAIVGSTDKSVANVEYGGTYTKNANPQKTEDVVPGGSGTFAVGGESEGGLAGIIPPGQMLHLVITNSSGKDAKYTFRAVWWEE